MRPMHALRLALPFVLCSPFLAASCGHNPARPWVTDLESFKTLARRSACADLKNRLFLIDRRFVFWDRAGQCADAGYAQMLFGTTVDDVLCRSEETIAGPVKGCSDETFGAMFETIIAHTDQADLGLGPSHLVQAISF